MNLNVKDEILTGEPKYKIKQNDATLYDNVTIEMVTPVQQEGTPINKELFDTISKYLIPTGIICMWSGSAVPSDWHLCDGTNGTPDLRNRFIVGAGSTYNIGDIGGSDTVTLTVDEMPKHSHTYYEGVTDDGYEKNLTAINDDALYVNKKTQTTSVGGDKPHENRPPYYALAYIMKIAE